MLKKQFNILFAVLLLWGIASCNNEKRVYESENSNEKKKRVNFTVGKFNKLVKSGDMEAKYAAAVKYYDKKDYTRAQTLFEELMSVYRGTAKAEEVHYYFAYCNYNLQDFIVAGYHFRNFV